MFDKLEPWMDIEKAAADPVPATSVSDLLVLCLSFSQLFTELWRRIKMEVVVEVRPGCCCCLRAYACGGK